MEASTAHAQAAAARVCRMPNPVLQQRVHLVGVGGSGMAGLAAFLARCGVDVSGSDRRPGPVLEDLRRRGVPIVDDQTIDSLPAGVELVVASAAVPPDNPELVAARHRGVRIMKYAELLGEAMRLRQGIAIAGTHGKSTTTAWLAYVMREAGLAPSYIVGANVPQLGGGSGADDGPHFVAEACEYDRSFLRLHPRSAVILNIDEDHLDYYRDMDDIRDAFSAFAARIPADGLLLLNGDDASTESIRAAAQCHVETFGCGANCAWRATDVRLDDGAYRFTLAHRDKPLASLRPGLAGRHNTYNALAVAALAHYAGVPLDQLAGPIEAFHGASRRLDLRGEVGGVRVLDDYAHHPAELRATLRAIHERFAPPRLWCIFQPHQHSRTRFLLDDFAASFDDANRIIVPRIYFVRDSARDQQAVCAADLVERIRSRGGDAEHIAEFNDIIDRLVAEVVPGDLVVTMGAGNVGEIADALVHRLDG